MTFEQIARETPAQTLTVEDFMSEAEWYEMAGRWQLAEPDYAETEAAIVAAERTRDARLLTHRQG